MQTHLAKVKGLGSAKSGTHHWWLQRVTALALIPLSIWFVYSILTISSLAQDDALNWLAQPLNGILMLLFVPILLKHSFLGLQVVIEDYVHAGAAKFALLLGVKFLTYFLMATSVVAILTVVVG